MIVVYHCYGGAHSSVVGAAFHLGLLSSAQNASQTALETLPYFDKNDPRELGLVHLLGHTPEDHPVVAVGRTNQMPLLIRALGGIGRIYGGDDVLFVDTSQSVNWRMIAGGIMSRRLNMRSLGHPLVNRGTVKAAPKLARLAEEAKNWTYERVDDPSREKVTKEIHYVPAGDQDQAGGEEQHWGQRKVIYHCRDGVHCSMVVAALHAGLLPVGRKPTPDELEELFSPRPLGSLRYCGTAPGGREVYVLGTNGHKQLMSRAIKSFVRSCYAQHPLPLLFDATRMERGKVRLGLLAQQQGRSVRGKKLLIQGILEDYPQFETMATDIQNLLIRPRLDPQPLHPS